MNDASTEVTVRERRKDYPNRRPKDAASMILVERRGGVPHVLMGRRSQRHAFYPGAFVFPGGAVDRTDGGVATADELSPGDAERLMRDMKGLSSIRRARALALAGVRETFEEAGILIGVADGDAQPPRAADWRAFFDHGIMPALSPLAFIARAITPPRRARRYDTRFFAVEADAIAKILPADKRPSAELSELIWLPIEEAAALPIPQITGTILKELDERLAGPGGLAADVPVPFHHMRRGTFVRELI